MSDIPKTDDKLQWEPESTPVVPEIGAVIRRADGSYARVMRRIFVDDGVELFVAEHVCNPALPAIHPDFQEVVALAGRIDRNVLIVAVDYDQSVAELTITGQLLHREHGGPKVRVHSVTSSLLGMTPVRDRVTALLRRLSHELHSHPKWAGMTPEGQASYDAMFAARRAAGSEPVRVTAVNPFTGDVLD